MDVQPDESLQAMFRYVLITQNHIHQMETIAEAFVEVSDYLEDQNLPVAARIIDHMPAEIQQIKVNLNFLHKSEAARSVCRSFEGCMCRHNQHDTSMY